MYVNQETYYWELDTGFTKQGVRFILDNQVLVKIADIPAKTNGDPYDYTLTVREFFDLTDSDPSTGTLLQNIIGSLDSLTTREKEITFDLPSANFDQGKVYSLEFMLTDPDNSINVRGVQITFEVQKRSITSIGSLIQQFFSAAFTLSGNAINSVTNKIVDQLSINASDDLAGASNNQVPGALAAKNYINNSINNVTFDLDYTASSTDGEVTNTAGSNATIPLVDSSNAGLMSPGQNDALDDLDFQLEITRANSGNNDDGQILFNDPSQTTKGLTIGYNTTGEKGYIKPRNVGVAVLPLDIEAAGVALLGTQNSLEITRTNPANNDEGHVLLSDPADRSRGLTIGYNTSANKGYIKPRDTGVTLYPFDIEADGVSLIGANNFIHFGNKDTDGTIRLRASGGQLVAEKRTAGVYGDTQTLTSFT